MEIRFLKQPSLIVEEIVMQVDTTVEFKPKQRRGLIVWVYSLRQLKNLKRYGLVHYVSRKLKYVVLYLDETGFEETMEKIEHLHFVRNVEPSYRPDVEMNFADKIGTKAAYQVTDDDGFDVEEMNTTIRLAENV